MYFLYPFPLPCKFDNKMFHLYSNINAFLINDAAKKQTHNAIHTGKS